MAWPYEFLDLTKDEKHARRLALDRYASLAQLLVFAPTFVALLARLCVWAVARAKTTKGDYNAIPASPSLKLKRTSIRGGWAATARKFKWWLQDDIVFRGQNWGQRDQWIFGILWAAVLLVLCVVGTGRDYLHLTKRFGIIAASQMPLQYLLALKFLNPFAFVLRSSHEQVNRWHRVLGRIIYGLLCLHAMFYLNYFYHHSITKKRLIAPIVAAGVAGFIGLTLLSSTSLSFIRRYSYRVFFITHLVVAVLMPPMIILHARPSNLYMAEALIVFVFDLAARKTSTIASDATVESIPGTNLVKISAAIPYNRINSFREHPGSHIYLSIPAAARPSSNPASINYLLFEFLFNPFTVAAVDETTGDLTLVARHRTGPLTAALARFAHGNSGGNASAPIEKTKMPLAIEGPYGAVTHFPILSGGHFDRVLLVAGGIGATFTVPIYRALRQDSPQTKVDLVWAVRSAGDATWALAGQEDGRAILNDKSIHIYLTGDIVDAVPAAPASTGGSSSVPGDGDAVEMNTLQHDHRRNRLTANANNRRRPDLKKIIDDTFKHGLEERVAILVCGPEAMGRELRQYVGPWVMKGRSIWWHNESFDW